MHIEDVAWWSYAPKLKGAYGKVVRTPPAAVDKQHLASALAYLEALGEPYDVALLTHGIPNYLTASAGTISYEDIGALALPHLRLVFMQACYSTSLAADWLRVGAEAVMSFPDETQSFLYYGMFLEHLRRSPDDIAAAYAATNRELPRLFAEEAPELTYFISQARRL